MSAKEKDVDLIYLALMALVWLLAVGVLRGCERLVSREDRS